MRKLTSLVLPRLEKRVSCIYKFSGEMPDLSDIEKTIVWERASIDLIDRAFKNSPKRAKVLKKLLAEGAIGIIILDGNQWLAHGFISPPGVALPKHLPSRIVLKYWWMFYMHTRPAFRGQGLQKKAILLRLKEIHEAESEIKDIMTDINIKNIPSRKAFNRIGFKPAGVSTSVQLYFPRFGSKTLWWRWDKNKAHPES